MDSNLFLVLTQQNMLIQDVDAFAIAKVFLAYFAVKRQLIITNPTPILSAIHVSFS